MCSPADPELVLIPGVSPADRCSVTLDVQAGVPSAPPAAGGTLSLSGSSDGEESAWCPVETVGVEDDDVSDLADAYTSADEEAIEDGTFWRHISPDTQTELDGLQNIGPLALTFLHGHVVLSATRRIRRVPSYGVLTAVHLAEISGRLIVRMWKKRDLSNMLRVDYEGLVDIFATSVVELAVQDDNDLS